MFFQFDHICMFMCGVEYGQPRNVVKSLVPSYNSLSWFEVCEASHHQVFLPLWHTVIIDFPQMLHILWSFVPAATFSTTGSMPVAFPQKFCWYN